jgi:hypothetical protein
LGDPSRSAAIIHVKFDAEGITPAATLWAMRKKALET